MAEFKRGDLVSYANDHRVYVIFNDKPWGQYWLVLSVRAFSWDFEVEDWKELSDIMEKQNKWSYGEDFNGYAGFSLTRICTGDEWELDDYDRLLVKGVPYV